MIIQILLIWVLILIVYTILKYHIHTNKCPWCNKLLDEDNKWIIINGYHKCPYCGRIKEFYNDNI